MHDFREQLIMDLDRRRTGFRVVGSGSVTLINPNCGDEVSVAIERDGNLIRSLTWNGHGCVMSMASASALAELAAGLTLTEFKALRIRFDRLVHGPVAEEFDPDHDLGDAAAFAGVGHLPLRAGCATLAWRAAVLAVEPSTRTGLE